MGTEHGHVDGGKRLPLGRAGMAGVGGVVALAVVVGVAMRGPDPSPGEDLVPAEATSESGPVASALDSVEPEPVLEPEPKPEPRSWPDAAWEPEGVDAKAARSLHVARPKAVKGIYLNAWAAGSDRKLSKLLALADRTEINAFVIDVKEGGEISYDSRVPLVDAVDADRRYIGDVRGMLARLRAHGVYPIARIVAFKDPILAKARPEWSIQHVDGGLWKDNSDNLWVDSFNREVWDYNIAIAREALALGFAEVQWDYVRFPDAPRSYTRNAVYPARAGRTMEDGIREFVVYSKEQLAEHDVPITADVFGLATSARNDLGIGQRWEKLVDVTDVLLPMVYPSHYGSGNYGLKRPNAQPYRTVLAAMNDAVARSRGYERPAVIRPWLQDFTLGQPRYGPEHVRAQIEAVYDAGLAEWVLWNPGSNYTPEALAPENGPAPVFPGTTPAPLPDSIEPEPEPELEDDGLLGEPVQLEAPGPDTVP